MTDDQPREMQLIERLRELPPKLPVSRAAKRAGMHESRWRQLAKGYQQVTSGTRVAAKAPADTLARMARAVGAKPDDLRAVGRDDAATVLESLPADVRSGRGEHLLRMAVIDTLRQLTTVTELALKQEDTRALTTSTRVAVELAELLQDEPEEVSLDESEPGGTAAAEARSALESVGDDGGIEDTVYRHQ